MPDGRMRRVDEAVRAVISDAIAKDLQDPRVGFVTVTAVKTSPDLRHARVYVSVLGDEQARSDTLEGLRSAHGFLQGRVAGRAVAQEHAHDRRSSTTSRSIAACGSRELINQGPESDG